MLPASSQRRAVWPVWLVLLLCLPAAGQKQAPVPAAEQHYERGVALLDKQQLDEAITELVLATRLNPRSADAYNALGIAWTRRSFCE